MSLAGWSNGWQAHRSDEALLVNNARVAARVAQATVAARMAFCFVRQDMLE